jgi:hemerythrin-like metal-binding protein
VKHFETEEAFMEQQAYPFYPLQKKQHQKFIRWFEGFKREIKGLKENRTYLMFRLQILIVDWLINHTLKEDMHFKKYLKKLAKDI